MNVLERCVRSYNSPLCQTLRYHRWIYFRKPSQTCGILHRSDQLIGLDVVPLFSPFCCSCHDQFIPVSFWISTRAGELVTNLAWYILPGPCQWLLGVGDCWLPGPLLHGSSTCCQCAPGHLCTHLVDQWTLSALGPALLFSCMCPRLMGLQLNCFTQRGLFQRGFFIVSATFECTS